MLTHPTKDPINFSLHNPRHRHVSGIILRENPQSNSNITNTSIWSPFSVPKFYCVSSSVLSVFDQWNGAIRMPLPCFSLGLRSLYFLSWHTIPSHTVLQYTVPDPARYPAPYPAPYDTVPYLYLAFYSYLRKRTDGIPVSGQGIQSSIWIPGKECRREI